MGKQIQAVILIGTAALLMMAILFLQAQQQEKAADSISVVKGETIERQAQQEGPDKSDPLLTLVNFERPIPEDWKVDLVQLDHGQSIDRRAYPNLQKMINDARDQGLDPLICSSYRTNAFQKQLFHEQVTAYQNRGLSKKEAEKEAAVWVAVPGTSEHQLGLAVDLVSLSNQNLNHSQENTALQKWLMKNSWKYGFILRYPSDKSSITGIGYEPWHYRYVGKKAAKAIYEQGVCLEEYLQK
ncbi:M15 family metallopeptidase [Eubacteriales bacterium DFI.9.88]|nr:M15 family metallopeptidase [Eubacteriales bacterium DFI.9.88]